MYSVGLTTTIIIVTVVPLIVAVIIALAVTIPIIICIKVKTNLKPDHATVRTEKIIDTQSNVAYGCVGGDKTSSVPLPVEYESTPITTSTTVDVQSNVAYGHVSGGKIPSTAVYETIPTDL